MCVRLPWPNGLRRAPVEAQQRLEADEGKQPGKAANCLDIENEPPWVPHSLAPRNKEVGPSEPGRLVGRYSGPATVSSPFQSACRFGTANRARRVAGDGALLARKQVVL